MPFWREYTGELCILSARVTSKTLSEKHWTSLSSNVNLLPEQSKLLSMAELSNIEYLNRFGFKVTIKYKQKSRSGRFWLTIQFWNRTVMLWNLNTFFNFSRLGRFLLAKQSFDPLFNSFNWFPMKQLLYWNSSLQFWN